MEDGPFAPCPVRKSRIRDPFYAGQPWDKVSEFGIRHQPRAAGLPSGSKLLHALRDGGGATAAVLFLPSMVALARRTQDSWLVLLG